MTDIEKACEAYECAAIVAANVIANDPNLNTNGISAVDIINGLRKAMTQYIPPYGSFQMNSSITKTKWEDYRPNANAFIDLAKRLAGQ